MNTNQLPRTTVATSALAAAFALLTAVSAAPADAMMVPHDPGFATSSQASWSPIDDLVTLRKTAEAQYYVDHATELDLR